MSSELAAQLAACHAGRHLGRLPSLRAASAGRFSEQPFRKESPISLRIESKVAGAWDRLRLEQVITHLVSNAVKYRSGTPVEVEVERQMDRAVIRVRDHGIGIDLVEASGGRIEVKSRLGQGATFTVSLPLSPLEPPSPKEAVHVLP